MKAWHAVSLLLIGGVVVAGVLKGRPEFSWECKGGTNSTTCHITNKGTAPGNVEFDAVHICHDGEHVAHVSAQVEQGATVTKIVEGFKPEIGLLSRCEGIDFRNKVVR